MWIAENYFFAFYFAHRAWLHCGLLSPFWKHWKQCECDNKIVTNFILVVRRVECGIPTKITLFFSYRFADEPEPRDTDNNPTSKRKYYSGKLLLKFKSDGYTDVILTDDNIRKDINKSDNNNNLIFQKVWGWDREISDTDNLEYLLFSADVILPRPTSNSENIATDIVGSIAERFYFQARVEKDETKNDVITLRDGSVTVKRSIQAPSIGGNAVGGWWGLFRGANQILAEFRLVGDFRCRGVKLD